MVSNSLHQVCQSPEQDPEEVLKTPGPAFVPEDGPDGGDGDGAGQQQELAKLEVGDADVQVATGESKRGTSTTNKTPNYTILQAIEEQVSL